MKPKPAMSWADIAREIGCSTDAARMAFANGIRKLKANARLRKMYQDVEAEKAKIRRGE